MDQFPEPWRHHETHQVSVCRTNAWLPRGDIGRGHPPTCFCWTLGSQEQEKASNSPIPLKRCRQAKIIWKSVTTEQLQKNNVPTPARATRSPWDLTFCFQYSSESQLVSCRHPQTVTLCDKGDEKTESTSSNSHISQKRRASCFDEAHRQIGKFRKL